MGTSVVVVLNDRKRLHQLRDRLAELQPPLLQLEAVGEGEQAMAEVARLNPAVARRARQQGMARWLIPFGFLAGLTFTYITDLDTFAFAGAWSQHLIGALLGAVLINYAKSLVSEALPETWLFIQGGLFLLVVTALPDGLVGWWRSGGPGRIRAMVGWPTLAATYPELDLDPAVKAEKTELEGGGR